MKKFILLFCSVLITLSLSANTSGKKQAKTKQLINKLKKNIASLQTQPSDEIFSPEIKKEQLRDIQQVSHELDNALASLPNVEQQKLLQNIQDLINPAKQNIKTLMREIVRDEWQNRKLELVQFASTTAQTAMISTIIALTVQAAKIGTGNLLSFNTDALVIAGLDAVAGSIINALSHYQTSGSITATNLSTIINQALIIPSVQARRYSISMPSITPSFNYWILSEGIAITSRFAQENDAAIQKIVKNIQTKDILFGKQLATDTAQIASTRELMQEIVSSKNVQRALAIVGQTVFQAAIIGGLLYLAGFGYAQTSMIQSMGYATLTSVAQATVAQVANMRNTSQPGALINIAAAPLAQQLFAIGTSTPQAAASAVLHAATTEVSNVLLQERDGLWGLMKKGGTDIKNAISSGWANTWSALSEGWSTLQEVEPVPL